MDRILWINLQPATENKYVCDGYTTNDARPRAIKINDQNFESFLISSVTLSPADDTENEWRQLCPSPDDSRLMDRFTYKLRISSFRILEEF
uniref:Uncharacterized protein n=1 Tax=Salix viminalis TaxID=40686 RepID=A0A6N2MWT4_SALVM